MTSIHPLAVYWWPDHPYNREYVHGSERAGKGLPGLTTELFNDRWRNVPAHLKTSPIGVLYTAKGAHDISAVLKQMWTALEQILDLPPHKKSTMEVFAEVQGRIDEIWAEFLTATIAKVDD